jgi:hypothetical protein
MKKEHNVNDFINNNSNKNNSNSNDDNNRDRNHENGANYSMLSGKVMAAFIAASIGLLSIGVLTYLRESIQWLVEIWKPTASLGGVMLYGYLIWVISWIVLYFTLRNAGIKKSNNIRNRTTIKKDLRVWLIVFFISLSITTVLIELSLKWQPIF